jgi:hypothetical protein
MTLVGFVSIAIILNDIATEIGKLAKLIKPVAESASEIKKVLEDEISWKASSKLLSFRKELMEGLKAVETQAQNLTKLRESVAELKESATEIEKALEHDMLRGLEDGEKAVKASAR